MCRFKLTGAKFVFADDSTAWGNDADFVPDLCFEFVGEDTANDDRGNIAVPLTIKMEVFEDLTTCVVIRNLDVFREVEGSRFNDLGREVFEGFLDIPVFSEVILFIGHDEEVGVDAEDFVSEFVFESAGDGNDADERHDAEHDAEDGDERDDGEADASAVKQVA